MAVSGKVAVIGTLGVPLAIVGLWFFVASEQELAPRYDIGTTATGEDIARIDIDVRGDGLGLPPGSGTPAAGKIVYGEQCASCHGATGTEGPNDILVGRIEGDEFTLADDPAAVRSIGSYWPFAATVFDYVRRAMPLEKPGSLSDDEVYAVTAYLLFLNGLIDEEAVIDAAFLPNVKMPARGWYYSGYEEAKGGSSYGH